jgi:hypothetical protein
VRMREWACVEGEKEGLYKDKGDIWCTATRVRNKDGCSVHRDTRLTLRRLVYLVLSSGLIHKFYLYSVFPSST